jgi:hypothetical protein
MSMKEKKIFKGGYPQLRYLKEHKGKISLMYEIMRREKELPKLQLFEKINKQGRGRTLPGRLSHAFMMLKVLGAIKDNGLKMELCKVRFVKEYSEEEVKQYLEEKKLPE